MLWHYEKAMKGCGVKALLVAAVMVAAGFASCRDDKSHDSGDELVVAVGDSALMLRDVLQQIPRGLEPGDSLAMFREIVETWLRRQVVTSVAERNIPDIEQIDRMVENYRSDLILDRYLAMMLESGSKKISDKEIDAYYSRHKDSLVLSEPVVKGIFLKVGENDPELPDLRRWMAHPDEKAVDRLERNGLRGAVQYEYFQDRWHPWHELAELVPYRFFDADAFLESTKDFETSYGGSVYIIHITDYVGTGRQMPEDYARAQIEEQLRRQTVVNNRRRLISDIYSREIEDGRVRGGLYDPTSGNLKEIKK